ncbi:MAG: molybdenum cofactor biosynthesis protein MoaE [Candidatus Nezhaarchaeota archaeon]|nr:molybdenum cofactor biosynthesis protein MoaE [Candidatus Nezhaarchaeota archaeon]MCX8142527.1 molybdenum cofactor biosynthesis protein MoaE [Candidatus Nezhaarchaeota archaeon]MDW8050500.1 molybdenum cofactor biosynthesis protein MoaE [Nitrososphaerota archaeon]
MIKDVGVHPKGSITLQELMDDVKRGPNAHRIGCMLTFTGVVRGVTKEGLRVHKLEYEAYPEIAEARLKQIVEDLKRIPGIIDVRIHHATGSLNVGEESVYIVVASEHREEGFKALREAIERVKAEVPIWKKEYTEEGSYWVGVESPEQH